ncbi:uncharacterized protein LOC143596094 [Bidens hawaiensis]|uniref:uncharacterized protein LOC143596094 n=1 Tax=Bidens hawaiensis TaxID=980011 RepID=UPI00404A3AF8
MRASIAIEVYQVLHRAIPEIVTEAVRAMEESLVGKSSDKERKGKETQVEEEEVYVPSEDEEEASSIKYLFKYINKGLDRATIYFSKNDTQADVEQPEVDEIKKIYDFRYLYASEAALRIFGYDVHYRMPSVNRLPFHLPVQEHVVYGADDDLDNALDKVKSVSSSMFTAWMKCNQKVEGPKSFKEIHTVNGRLQPSFRDACYTLGLLEDDQECIEAIEEASNSLLGHGVCTLFATMLSTDSLSRPEHVWINTWKWLSDDILYNQRRLLNSPELSLTKDQIKQLTFFKIEKILLRNNSSLRKYKTMPFPDAEYISIASNSLIHEEVSYNQNLLKVEFQTLFNSITHEQKNVFDHIMMDVQQNKGCVFFVCDFGGTVKT